MADSLLVQTTVPDEEKGRELALEEKIRAFHPCKVPEIIALPILEGSADYLKWIEAETD